MRFGPPSLGPRTETRLLTADRVHVCWEEP